MQIVPVEEKEIPKKIGRKCGVVLTPLLEFMELGVKCGRLILEENRNPRNTISALNMNIRNYHMPVKAVQRGREVFLIREDM